MLLSDNGGSNPYPGPAVRGRVLICSLLSPHHPFFSALLNPLKSSWVDLVLTKLHSCVSTMKSNFLTKISYAY